MNRYPAHEGHVGAWCISWLCHWPGQQEKGDQSLFGTVLAGVLVVSSLRGDHSLRSVEVDDALLVASWGHGSRMEDFGDKSKDVAGDVLV